MCDLFQYFKDTDRIFKFKREMIHYCLVKLTLIGILLFVVMGKNSL